LDLRHFHGVVEPQQIGTVIGRAQAAEAEGDYAADSVVDVPGVVSVWQSRSASKSTPLSRLMPMVP
jgi:hypothetical protein